MKAIRLQRFANSVGMDIYGCDILVYTGRRREKTAKIYTACVPFVSSRVNIRKFKLQNNEKKIN